MSDLTTQFVENPLQWEEEFDDFDNSIWEANSPYHDEGVPFQFRIKQRLRDNKHEFFEASDAELMTEDERTWTSLEQAKADLQKDADDMRKSER